MFDKKAVFINTVSQVTVRLVTLVFTLVSIKLLTNYLGTAGVGEYNTITTYINFFIVIADLGLFSVAVREIAKNPNNEKKILSNVFLIRLVSALLACIIASALVFATKYNFNIKLGVLIATGFLLFNLLGSIYDIVLQYRLKMQYSATAEFLSKLAAIIALYVIIRMHGSFLWVVSTVALTGVLIYIFKWLFSIKFTSFVPKYDRQISNWILSLSWPLGIVFIINNLYFKLDTLLLFAIKGSVAVGIYTVAYKVLEVTAFIGSYFSSALKPAISQNIQSNKASVGNIIEKSITIMLAVAMPLTITCVVFSKEIILFLSNADFLSGSWALMILSFALPLIYFDNLLGEILLANDERKLLIKISIFILSFNLIANLIFIPLFSFIGAAVTTVVSELLLLLINAHYTQKIVGYRFNFRLIFKVLLAAFLALVVGFLSKQSHLNFLILIPVVVALYFLLLYLFNVVKPQTFREILKS
ncbi:MAG: flippase [Patescibacteria group bacterium]|jgi:O-antigen/teichoic acid export membrane protein